ncbi:MAG: hypothetical protein AABY83_01150 [Pseudomonadota bacterium]
MRQQINFYSGKIRTPFSVSPVVMIAASVLLSVAAALALGLQQQSKLNNAQLSLASLGTELNAAHDALSKTNKDLTPLPVDASLDNAIELLEKKIKVREALAETIEAQLAPKSVAISPLFIALAKHHAQGLWLSSVRIQRAKGILSIHGNTVNSALISGYLTKLTNDPRVTKTGFNFLRLTFPEDTTTEKKTTGASEFILTTEEDEIRDPVDVTKEITTNNEQKDFFKDSFALINQLKMLSQ